MLKDEVSLGVGAINLADWGDLRTFGLGELAYVRRIVIQGQTLYSVHGADGSTLAVLDTQDTAKISIRNNDMVAVSIH